MLTKPRFESTTTIERRLGTGIIAAEHVHNGASISKAAGDSRGLCML